MGGRGTFAAENPVPYTYETVGNINGVKVLQGLNGKHGLPEEAHSSEMYIKLHRDGTLNMLRIYNDSHYLVAEIAYHPEPYLTGNHRPVLHIHYYDKNFNRSNAMYVGSSTFEKYKKYLIGRKWYD